MRITIWDPSRKVNHLRKVIWDRKIITEFTRWIRSTRTGKPVLMVDVKVSKGKSSRCVNWENLICVRWNRIKNCTKLNKVIVREKRNKTLSEVKLAENINKNLQSFLESFLEFSRVPVQKEVLLSRKLRDHGYEY